MFEKWLFIFLSVGAISIACMVIFTTSHQDQDPMAQQIHEINNLYPFDKEAKSKLISELIRKYQPATNAPVSVQLKQ